MEPGWAFFTRLILSRNSSLGLTRPSLNESAMILDVDHWSVTFDFSHPLGHGCVSGSSLRCIGRNFSNRISQQSHSYSYMGINQSPHLCAMGRHSRGPTISLVRLVHESTLFSRVLFRFELCYFLIGHFWTNRHISAHFEFCDSTTSYIHPAEC